MPVTRSELLFFAAGVAVGAAAKSAMPKIKEALAPLLAGAMSGAGAGVGDACAEIARVLSEKFETVQDAMAERTAGTVRPAETEPSSAAA